MSEKVKLESPGTGQFKGERWGDPVAQLVKHRTHDFDSGHDFRVIRSIPPSGSALSRESA